MLSGRDDAWIVLLLLICAPLVPMLIGTCTFPDPGWYLQGISTRVAVKQMRMKFRDFQPSASGDRSSQFTFTKFLHAYMENKEIHLRMCVHVPPMSMLCLVSVSV